MADEFSLIEKYFKSLSEQIGDDCALLSLADGEELEYLGYRDYLNATTICLIEWPERARGYLSNVGLEVSIEYAEEDGRRVELIANNDWGNSLIASINPE